VNRRTRGSGAVAASGSGISPAPVLDAGRSSDPPWNQERGMV
jgi:hypothetical protein